MPGPLGSEELTSLLGRTSRTFALTIPLLDEPLRSDVGLSYLLFRIADTLEDAPLWGRDTRLVALDSFAEWLVGDEAERGWLETARREPPTTDDGCLALLARADAVREALVRRGEELATLVSVDVVRTSSKMAEFVARQSDRGGLVLRDMEDLRAYCYAVAGIVGELLTSLFVLREPRLGGSRDLLMALAPAFGEGLQLVNILKDAPSDAGEGRIYVPPGTDRADVFRLARSGLERARAYIEALEDAGASPQLRAFCELPVRLADKTLDHVEQGGTKLTREEVVSIALDVMRRS